MESIRKPTEQEVKLIELLINKSTFIINEDWKNNLFVNSMDDGNMGSLNLHPNGEVLENRIFLRQISECQFTDKDGVEVLVSLNIDSNEKLFELDIWKSDFNQLIELPTF